MRVSLLQMNIAWSNPAQNVKTATEMLEHHPGADVYVLPEMFSTGFCTVPENVAESVHCDTLQWMHQWAAGHHCAVAGSIAMEEKNQYYNRFFFVTPDGKEVSYDKKHLFTYGGEHLHYTAGSKRVVARHKGVRFLLQVCYDLRFPVASRNRGDYDVAVYVASWPTPRIEAWMALLRARAIENQCYVVGVNRVGTDPNCQYCGGTVAFDPYGNVLVQAEWGCQEVVTFDVDMEALQAFRAKFPVLHDADAFELK